MKEIKIYLENIQTKIEHLTTENKTGKSLNNVRITRERERDRERERERERETHHLVGVTACTSCRMSYTNRLHFHLFL